MSNTTTKTSETNIRSFLILAFLSTIWGSSFFLIKKGLIAFAPEQVACLRISFSGLAFLPIFILQFKKIDWSQWKPLLVVATAGSSLPAFLFSTAQTEVSSSVAGVLNSLTPLFVLILGYFFFKLELNAAKIIGVLLGFVGAAFLILFGETISSNGNNWYALLIVLASLFYAISANTIQTYFKNTSPTLLSAATFVMVAPPAIFYLLYSDFFERLNTHPFGYSSLGSVFVLAMFGTVLASLIFYKLIQSTSAVFASTVAYLIPIVALLLGTFDGEVITVYHLVGMGLILIGVYFSKKS